MNFQSSLDTIIAGVSASQTKQSLLLHACCAPCVSYVIEYLVPYFDVTLSFFNPNIQPREEYGRRLAELYRLLELTNRNINVIEGAYFDRSWGNCAECIGFRIADTAKLAASKGFDYFCSTLSISPHKNAELINELGLSAASEYGSKWLPNDFKKRNGYLRSVQICRELNIYRQSYCGCLVNK